MAFVIQCVKIEKKNKIKYTLILSNVVSAKIVSQFFVRIILLLDFMSPLKV